MTRYLELFLVVVLLALVAVVAFGSFEFGGAL